MGIEYRAPGLITMIPRASAPSKKYGELSFDEIKALTTGLTEEEKQSKFADLYDWPNALTENQKLIIAGKPLNPDKAFEPEDYASNMNVPGSAKVENGYCVLPSGVGFSAVRIEQHGRNNEKMDAYNKDFAVEGALAYKLWCPGYHYYHYSDGCVEDFGYGKLNMQNMLDSESYCNGIDMTLLGIDPTNVRQNDPSCIWTGGNYWRCFPVLEDRISETPIEILIVNYLRETDYGRELRVRLFTGIGIHNGKLFRSGLPENSLPMVDYARLHMRHLMLEYGNEARLVNEFWHRTHCEE